jgi:hypothetical protein
LDWNDRHIPAGTEVVSTAVVSAVVDSGGLRVSVAVVGTVDVAASVGLLLLSAQPLMPPRIATPALARN